MEIQEHGFSGNSRERNENNDDAMKLVGYGDRTASFLLFHGRWLFNQSLSYVRRNWLEGMVSSHDGIVPATLLAIVF